MSQLDIGPVERCTLAVPAGTLVAILGPPGSGRSSLARVLVGLDRPERGRVVLDGVDVTEVDPAARSRFGVGYVPPRPQVFPTLTVAENLVVALTAGMGRRRWRRRDAVPRAEATLERAGLVTFADVPAWRLAPDDTVRLTVAMALASPRRLLVVDELTALAGDPDLLEELAVAVCTVAQLGGAVVWFDSPGRLPVIPDRVVLLVGGRVVADGPPHDVETGPEWAELTAGDIGNAGDGRGNAAGGRDR